MLQMRLKIRRGPRGCHEVTCIDGTGTLKRSLVSTPDPYSCFQRHPYVALKNNQSPNFSSIALSYGL